MRRNGTVLVLAFVILAGVWLYFAILNSVTFWAVDEEGTILSIAQAVNLDFWDRTNAERGLSEAQFYQPGMWFQLQSWLVYRLTAGSGSPMELFHRTMMDPSSFWRLSQIGPLLIALITTAWLWWRSRKFTASAVILVLSVYYTCLSALKYGVFMPWNESLSLLLGLIFFTAALKCLSERPGRNEWLWLVAAGIFGGFLYMHKMNYAVWACALIPALWMKSVLGERKIIRTVLQTGLHVFTAAASTLGIAYWFLGPQGKHRMFSIHQNIVMGSNQYGNGERTVVKLGKLIENLQAFIRQDAGTAVLLILFFAFSAALVLRKRRDREWLKNFAPELVLYSSAAFVMTFAILKQFQLQYTVSVAAVFPLWTIWFVRSAPGKWPKFFVPVVALVVLLNFFSLAKMRDADFIRTAEVEADEADIYKMPLEQGVARLWMYRSTSPTYSRLFVVSFTGLDLNEEVVKIQGEERVASPWNNLTSSPRGGVPVSEVKWRYMVIPKITLQNLMDWKIHTWIDDPSVRKTELRQSVVYEKQP